MKKCEQEIICIKPEVGKQGTHTVDIAMRLRKEIQSPREVLLDLGPDGHVTSPGVALLPHGVGEIRGDNVHSPGVIFFPLDASKIRGCPDVDDRKARPKIGTLGHLRRPRRTLKYGRRH